MKRASQSSSQPEFRCVVQVGFAGSRRLFDPPLADPTVRTALEQQVEKQFAAMLDEVPSKLGLQPHHFLCGISQIAIGADTIFTRVCQGKQIPQRIFLSQHREEYLSAVDSEGTSDFTTAERDVAESLLASPHIIQEHVVSESADRTQRFEEVNSEILRVSDVIICLTRADAESKPGGTLDLLEQARQRHMPVLDIRIRVQDGPSEKEAVLDKTWHNLTLDKPWQPPNLPEELADGASPPSQAGLPSSLEYCQSLKAFASDQAAWYQGVFKLAAATILATHLVATTCATAAVGIHAAAGPTAAHLHSASFPSQLIIGLLIFELLMLVGGCWVHFYLHRTHAARVWAMSRLLAEIARSVLAMPGLHLYLTHLFQLAMPARLRPLLRTVNVLHLRTTYAARQKAWEPQRDTYAHDRLDMAEEGQIDFYTKRLADEQRSRTLCNGIFLIGTVLAFLATAVKLLVVCCEPDWLHDSQALTEALLGSAAIILPALAVGGLSWAASMDYEARIYTFDETLKFLIHQRQLFADCRNRSEFEKLVLETELRLLGETVNWYSRRSFTNVT